MIILVYFRLVVHADAIIDTSGKKWLAHTVAQFVLAQFNQYGEEQNTLSSPQLYCHSQEHTKWLVNW